MLSTAAAAPQPSNLTAAAVNGVIVHFSLIGCICPCRASITMRSGCQTIVSRLSAFCNGGRVLWLVDAQLTAAGQLDAHEPAKPEVSDRLFDLHALLLQLGYRGLDVVAHEIQLMAAAHVVGMHGDL